ncbi:hypothetical protein D3C71_2192440 [compost metagenome]
MPDLSHCRDIGSTAQAGFIGEHASFDSHYDGAANEAAECLVQAEGAFDDGQQHHWHVIELQNNHVERYRYVG